MTWLRPQAIVPPGASALALTHHGSHTRMGLGLSYGRVLGELVLDLVTRDAPKSSGGHQGL